LKIVAQFLDFIDTPTTDCIAITKNGAHANACAPPLGNEEAPKRFLAGGRFHSTPEQAA